MKKILLYKDMAEYDCATAMAIDEMLLKKIENEKEQIIRIYTLKEPAITIGKNQRYNSLNNEYCKKNKIEIVRRITGGSGVFHKNDILISGFFLNKKNEHNEIKIFFPTIIKKILTNTNLYIKKNNEEIKECQIKEINYRIKTDCFSVAIKNELVYNNAKIYGIAFYITKNIVMAQSSLQLKSNLERRDIFNEKELEEFDLRIEREFFINEFV
ncbi:MAG TPA: hypothetical protein PK189_11460, partial [bacterium]|nr:hypothetical protein [bacterium]